jgi:hypothetical protein
MAKRNQPAQPRARRSRANDTGASFAEPARAEELPTIPEPGDAADQAARETAFDDENIRRRAAGGSETTPTEAGDIQSASLDAVTSESAGDTSGADNESESMTSDSMGSEPSEADIRLRAYHRYLERGGGHGAHFDDWVTAERELRRNDRARKS